MLPRTNCEIPHYPYHSLSLQPTGRAYARMKPVTSAQFLAAAIAITVALTFTPMPIDFRERMDYFGNRVAYFAIQQPHNQLTVTAISEVTIFPKQNTFDLFNQMTWEQARNLLQETPCNASCKVSKAKVQSKPGSSARI